MPEPAREPSTRWPRRTRAYLLAWAALLALMLLSLGSAYLKLGVFNLVAGLVIAVLKAAVVLALYMGLRGSHVLLRATAMVAAFTLALLFTLGSLDNLTRPQAPAAMQVPQQLPALRPH